MRSEVDVRKQLKLSETQQAMEIMHDAEVFYGAYRQALIWVLGG